METLEEGQNQPKIARKQRKFQKIVEKMELDRISSLPDCLLLEILSGLPTTKDSIRTVCMRIDITSKSIKKLVLSGYMDFDNPFDAHIIDINAPNILSLTIKGNVTLWKLLLVNVSCLVEANLYYQKLGCWDNSHEEKEEEMLKGFILKRRHVKEFKIGVLCSMLYMEVLLHDHGTKGDEVKSPLEDEYAILFTLFLPTLPIFSTPPNITDFCHHHPYDKGKVVMEETHVCTYPFVAATFVFSLNQRTTTFVFLGSCIVTISFMPCHWDWFHMVSRGESPIGSARSGAIPSPGSNSVDQSVDSFQRVRGSNVLDQIPIYPSTRKMICLNIAGQFEDASIIPIDPFYTEDDV
ncbi:hypothetical protein Lser_V15G05552 [Lactuca serriola]